MAFSGQSYINEAAQRELVVTQERVETPGEYQAAVTAFSKAYRFFRASPGAAWILDRNDGASQVDLGNDASLVFGKTEGDIPFKVRGISVGSIDATLEDRFVVQFDMAYSEGHVEYFVFGIERPFWVTALYLGTSYETTANQINLYG